MCFHNTGLPQFRMINYVEKRLFALLLKHPSLTSSPPIEKLDEKYLTLLQLLGNVDLSYTQDFHAQAESVYQRDGQSYVRYTRLTNAVANTRKLLKHLTNIGCSLHNIAPLADGSLEHRTFEWRQLNSQLTCIENSHSYRLSIKTEKPITRHEHTFSAHDDTAEAEHRWISPIYTNPIKALEYFSLPNTRISHHPTGIAFEHSKVWHYVLSMSDMFHYFRIGGKTAFKPVKKHFSEAYVLPRFGINNHFHSLADKLPALFGYTLLDLDCPIVSTYPLNDTELYFAQLMGIDTQCIHTDLSGEMQIDRGILCKTNSVKPLFFEFLQGLTQNPSPVGNRIYVSRAHSTDRLMLNEQRVHDTVKRYGFDIVFMEDYSLVEQMAIASNAETLVGPHGAGLANMVFAAPGSDIVELIPERYMTPLFRQLAIDCKHRYSVLIGTMAKSDGQTNPDISAGLNWHCNISRLENLLNQME